VTGYRKPGPGNKRILLNLTLATAEGAQPDLQLGTLWNAAYMANDMAPYVSTAARACLV
jgi:hypothetical protein